MKLTHFILQACLIAVLAISGCGGGGGSSSAPTPITQVTGIFVDARVSGLTYSCSPSGVSDLTTAQGEYTCTSGDDATFSIGRATLGTIAAQSGIITPYDFFPNDTNAAVNIARLLQTIDSNPNDDVITPDATLVSAIPENLNFSANGTTFKNIIEAAFADVDASVVLVSTEDAQAAMNASIVAEGETVPEAGHAPIANAGVNQNVVVGATVTINGASSSDFDGDPLTYIWIFQEKPPGSNASFSTFDVNVSFVTDVAGAYVVQLVVNDGSQSSAADTVTIAANAIPVANAGADQDVDTNALVTLDGTSSADPTNDPLTYTWTLTVPSGSSAMLSDATAIQPTFTTDIEGDYVATLIVDDGFVESDPDTVTIVATAPPSVINGFSPGWLDGRVLYIVILDTEDDDEDGSTTDWLLVGMKFENGIASYDFSADGIYETTDEMTGISYEIINGVLVRTDGEEQESTTITAVDDVKITTNWSVSWGDPDTTEYLYYERADAQAYMDQLNVPSLALTIPAPVDYYSFACSDPSIQFVIPVNINDDNQSDFIIHYWCDANPYGSVVDGPTADALVAQVSQPDGSYAVANVEVFGAAHYGLGGASRKVKRGDINGDGYDDFAFAMNWEDGRYNQDPNVCNTEPAVLMSTGPGTYEVVRLGQPSWGHGVGIVNNADGTAEVFFAGFTGENFQAFKYVNGEFIDVTDTYPIDAGNWATGVKAIDVNGVSEFIIGTWDSYDGSNPNEERLTGAKLYKRSGNSWIDVDEYGYPIAFSTPQISWSGSEGTLNVFDIEGTQYFGCSLEEFDVINGGLSGYSNDLIVSKLACAALITGGDIIEGVTYTDSVDTAPVNIYQFFEFSDAGLTRIESPIINEEIDITLNFFTAEDINGDDYPDLVAYAFTLPWSNSRVAEDGKPIVYLNDGNGNLVWTDISELPGFGVADGSQGLVDDVDNDGFIDLVLYGLKANPGSGDIVIHLLPDYIE